MKNFISKVALLLLCSAFTLSSCSDDDSVEKETVTIKHRILVSAEIDYKSGSEGGGIEELYLYTNKEMEAV